MAWNTCAGALERGLDIDDFAPRLSFFFNAHNDFFEEIAKYRAARRIWAREMRNTFHAQQERSWLLRFHTQTAGVPSPPSSRRTTSSASAIQALAAVLGGTQSLHTNSMDEALALPSEHAVTIALRTQQILAEESGVINTVDPLAGSFFVEAQTNTDGSRRYTITSAASRALGGVLPAIDKGFFQSEISDAAYRYQREIDEGLRHIVGVNAYPDDKPISIPILAMDPRATSPGVPPGTGAPVPRPGPGGAVPRPPAHRLPGHGEYHASHPGSSACLRHAG